MPPERATPPQPFVRDIAAASLAGQGSVWTASGRCQECDYDLRGLDPGAACPECGQVPRSGTVAPRAPDLSFQRSVAVGLVLMLFVTVYAISSVLVQPFTDDLAGTLPALNVPGPKLWVVPLLQRPIGRRPELAGMVGTRCALGSLLAVWLLTARPRDAEEVRHEGDGHAERATDSWIRPATRWASVILFGVAFGTLLASQGLWPSDLPVYRLVLVGGAELPAAALIYAHLRNLSARVPGRDRRALFDALRWFAPAVVAAGASLIAAPWLGEMGGPTVRHAGNRFALSVAYGVAAVTCGVVATAAVGSLALAYGAMAFPDAWRVASGTRRLAIASWRWFSSADALRVRFGCVAAGLLLLAVVVVLRNDLTLWRTTASGATANLPFINFPGPKLFSAATAVPELGRENYWQALTSGTLVVVLSLAAFRLITVRLDGREGDLLRGVVRWLPVVAVGAAMGCAAAWEAAESVRRSAYLTSTVRASAVYAGVTVLLELPATVLLYVYLARLAALYTPSRPLRRQLRAAAFVVAGVMVASLAAFAVSRGYQIARDAPLVLAIAGAFGAAALASAVWTTALVLTLAGSLARRAASLPAAPRAIRTVYRELPGSEGPAETRAVIPG